MTVSTRPLLKPDVESWEVRGKRYATTADLLASGSFGADGVAATYHYQTAADLRDTRLDKVLGGTAIGAASGAVVGGGLAFMGGVVSFLEQLAFYGSSGPVPVLGLVLGSVAVGAAIGAVAGANTPVAETHQVTGRLRAERQADGSSRPIFYEGGDLNAPVDLAEYAKAQPAPAATVEAVPWWKDSVKGAGAGAASAGLALFGFGIGQVGVVGKAASLGHGAAGGRTWGAVVGGAAGLGAVAGTIAAANLGGLPALAATAAGLTVGGALLGPVVGPRIRATEADADRYGQQWWNS